MYPDPCMPRPSPHPRRLSAPRFLPEQHRSFHPGTPYSLLRPSMHYRYDKDVKAVPDETLSIYGVSENQTISQAVYTFQSKHPDVYRHPDSCRNSIDLSIPGRRIPYYVHQDAILRHGMGLKNDPVMIEEIDGLISSIVPYTIARDKKETPESLNQYYVPQVSSRNRLSFSSEKPPCSFIRSP